MMFHRLGSRRGLSLRRAWRVMLVKLLAIIVGVIIVAVAVNQRELDRFATTMGDVREETSALVALDRALLESVGPMTVTLYRIPQSAEHAEEDPDYATARIKVGDAFERADAAMHTEHERELLAEARATWAEIDDTVLSSATRWSDEELRGLLMSGQDPFRAPVWDAYATLDLQRADVLKAAIDDMGNTVRATEQNHRLVLAVFAAALLGAVGLALAAGRRLSRTVRQPLEALCDASTRLPGLDDDQPIELPDAAVEIQ